MHNHPFLQEYHWLSANASDAIGAFLAVTATHMLYQPHKSIAYMYLLQTAPKYLHDLSFQHSICACVSIA